MIGVYDRKRAMEDMAKNEDVDVITGDWMSECNMTLRGSDKRDRLANREMATGSSVVAKGYEPYFLEEVDPAIPWLARKGTKLAVNAGASDVHGLAVAVKELIKKHGVDLKVGVVDGDDVTDAVLDLYKKGEPFYNLPANKSIHEWGFEPVCAQCYLGGTGIAECFRGGADIVLCGRVADASVTVGAAMWWWGWNREDHITELAGTLMVGHIIECSTYATGGYYSGFKDLGVNDLDMGYPIASVEKDGTAVVTMEKGRDGLVNVATIASQLLYEIQGPLYYNSDVTASIEDVKLEQVGKNAVCVSGIKGFPAPPTTKGKSAPTDRQEVRSMLTLNSWNHGKGWLASRVPLLSDRAGHPRESCHDRTPDQGPHGQISRQILVLEVHDCWRCSQGSPIPRGGHG